MCPHRFEDKNKWQMTNLASSDNDDQRIEATVFTFLCLIPMYRAWTRSTCSNCTLSCCGHCSTTGSLRSSSPWPRSSASPCPSGRRGGWDCSSYVFFQIRVESLKPSLIQPLFNWEYNLPVCPSVSRFVGWSVCWYIIHNLPKGGGRLHSMLLSEHFSQSYQYFWLL